MENTKASVNAIPILAAAQKAGMSFQDVLSWIDHSWIDTQTLPSGLRGVYLEQIQCRILAAGKPLAVESVNSTFDLVERPTSAPFRVLLIEDSSHFQHLISLLIQTEFPDAELLVAPDGPAGLAMVQQLRPDILITDIVLPGLDGTAIVSALDHQDGRTPKIIIVTSLEPHLWSQLPGYQESWVMIQKQNLAAELPNRLRQSWSVVSHC